MSFEDVEFLKSAFTVYGVPVRSPASCSSRTFLVIRKRNTTYTRVTVAPPVYSVKHHFKMLVYSLLSKLRPRRCMND
jgi:hypothetical protein